MLVRGVAKTRLGLAPGTVASANAVLVNDRQDRLAVAVGQGAWKVCRWESSRVGRLGLLSGGLAMR